MCANEQASSADKKRKNHSMAFEHLHSSMHTREYTHASLSSELGASLYIYGNIHSFMCSRAIPVAATSHIGETTPEKTWGKKI